MEDMVRAIEANGIRPVVDEQVFTLDKAREAYEYMVSLLSFCARYCADASDTVESKALWKNCYQDLVDFF